MKSAPIDRNSSAEPGTRSKRFRPAKLAIRVGVSLCIFVGALVATEFALRLTKPGQLIIERIDPEIGRLRIPNQRGYQPGNEASGEWVPLTINARGLRGAEIPPRKAAGERRVLCLGDSFMFGGGLGDDDTLTANAQRLSGQPPESVRFINGGGNGYDGREAAAFLDRFGESLFPDIVVFGWNWNDLVSILSDDDKKISVNPPWLMSIANFMHVDPIRLRSLGAYKFYAYHANPKAWFATTPERFQQYRDDVIGCATGPGTQPRWEAAKRAIGRMLNFCSRQKSRFVVMAMPELTWKESGTFVAMPHLTEMLTSMGISCVDAQPAFYEGFTRGEHMTQNLDSFHPSAHGQEALAKVLLDALWAKNWIPRSGASAASPK